MNDGENMCSDVETPYSYCTECGYEIENCTCWDDESDSDDDGDYWEENLEDETLELEFCLDCGQDFTLLNQGRCKPCHRKWIYRTLE